MRDKDGFDGCKVHKCKKQVFLVRRSGVLMVQSDYGGKKRMVQSVQRVQSDLGGKRKKRETKDGEINSVNKNNKLMLLAISLEENAIAKKRETKDAGINAVNRNNKLMPLAISLEENAIAQ